MLDRYLDFEVDGRQSKGLSTTGQLHKHISVSSTTNTYTCVLTIHRISFLYRIQLTLFRTIPFM